MSNKDLEQYYQEMRTAENTTVIHTNAGIFQMGDVFEAETVKGHKNYVIFMFVRRGFVYYFHGDRAKKVAEETFRKLIDYGDLDPIPPERVDPERKALAVLGLEAMANGVSFNDWIDIRYGSGKPSEARGF
jgi:hypothetical protein